MKNYTEEEVKEAMIKTTELTNKFIEERTGLTQEEKLERKLETIVILGRFNVKLRELN